MTTSAVPGAERLPPLKQLEADLAQARERLAEAEASEKAAAQRVDLLATATKNLNVRFIELGPICDTAIEGLFDHVVAAFSTADGVLPMQQAAQVDILMRERFLIGSFFTAVQARARKEILSARLAEAEGNYRRAGIQEAEAAILEAEFAQKISAAKLGPVVLEVQQAGFLTAKNAASAQTVKAIKAVDDARTRLSAYVEEHGGDLRVSLA